MKRGCILFIIFLLVFWIPLANPENSRTTNGGQVGYSQESPLTLYDNLKVSNEYDTFRLTKSPTDLDIGDISISPTGQIEIAYSNWAGRDAFVSEPTSLDIMPTGIDISPEVDGSADNDHPFSILHDQNGTRWIAYRAGPTDTSEACYVRELGDGTLGIRYQVATAASSNGECNLVQWSNGSYSMIFSASNNIYTASSWHGYITHSSNLVDWTTPTQVTSDWGRETRMTIDDNDRLWALIDNNNDGCKISYSDDGTSWHGTVTFPNTHYGDVDYSEYWDMLFFVYYNTTDQDFWFRTSKDGATWSDPIFAANSVSGIASMVRATVDTTGVLYLIYRDDVDGVDDIFAARIDYVPETNLGLAVGTSDGRVHLYEFNGLENPTLLWSNQICTGLIDNIMVVDIDGDRQSEVLVAAGDGYFYCLEGGTGFQRWNYSSPWANFVVWRDLFVEDLDQDGFYEIITAIECTSGGGYGGIVVLEHTGAEKTRNDTIITSGHNGNGPDRIDMIDYNHDGVRDVVCLYGDTLYSGAQPRIQVLDYTSGIGVLLNDFSYTYTSSGMTGLLLADLNDDGEPDFITTGWGCPVTAFNNSGIFNWSYIATGNADKVAMYSDNIDGLGTDSIIIGTGQYSNTNGLTMSIVHATNGSEIVTPLVLGISASSFRPLAVADIDSDNAKEIFLLTDVVGSTSDRVTSVDGLTGTEEWYVTVNKFADQILTPDLEYDGMAELVIGEANGFSLVYGNGTKLWTEITDGIPYRMALAEPLPGLLFDHFDTNDTAYNPNLWTLETYGSGEILYENNTQIGLHVWDHAYRTLVSKENFVCDVRALSKVKFSDANALPAFGWTDVIPNQWNYHPTDGNNGVWVEFNWPIARQLTLYTQSNGIESWKSVSVPDYTSYHQVELIWTETAAEMYIDGVLKASLVSNIPTIELPYKIINTCWAGDSPGQRFYTDYVNITLFTEGTTIASIHEPSEPFETEIVTVYANVTDTDGISQVILSYSVNDGSSWTNSTMIDHHNGTYTQVIPTQSASTTVLYKIYSEDNEGNWAGTHESSYTVLASVGPTVTTAHIPFSPDQDSIVTIRANVSDSDGVSSVILSYSINGGSSWTNSSMTDLANGTYIQTIPSQPAGTTVLYLVYANDTLDIWTVSSQESYIVVDTTVPTVDHPSDIEYEEGATGNTITWNPSDAYPASYQIFRNGVQIRAGIWNSSSEAITISIDGLPLGLYNYAIVVYDGDGNSASDLVLVTVVDLTPPLLDNPENIIYEEGSIGHNITWTPTDAHPTSYIVLRNGSEIEAGSWIGDSIVVFIDGLSFGFYNYTLVVIDIGGNRASDEVTVTVTAIITPTTTETTTVSGGIFEYMAENPVVLAALLGSFGAILTAYILSKRNPSRKYNIRFDGDY